MHPLILTMGVSKTTLNGVWSDINVAFPTLSGSNEDYQVSWTGGPTTRLVSAATSLSGTLQYRLDAASWQTYSASFAVSNGQTLGWRATVTGDNNAPVVVTVNGVHLDTFTVLATGFP